MKSIAMKVNATFVCFISIVIVACTVLVVTNMKQRSEVQESREIIALYAGDLTQLNNRLDEIRLSVTQVQQWLTDISATRGRDGLDDGFDEAARHAEIVRRELRAVREEAQAIGLGRVAEDVVATQKSFEPYYDIGQRMAEAYIAKGPAGGNAMMGAFDEKAAALRRDLKQLREHVGTAREAGKARITEKLDAVQAASRRNSAVMYIMVALLTAVAALGAFTVRRVVVKPLIRLRDTVIRVAAGHYDETIDLAQRDDELGACGRAVQTLQERSAEAERLEQEEAARKQQAAEERRRTMNALADRFEKSVGGVVGDVSTASEQIHGVADAMSRIAMQTEERAAHVATAAGQASRNVETVSSAAEELAASAKEIGRQVEQTSEIASSAADKVERTNEQVGALSRSADQISEVIDLIQDIAERTNLLALNATIEAARAGEAGKGFAVVANEVKNLASQTQKATERIRGQIETVQGETRSAVSAIQDIGKVVRDMNEIAQTVADAVEQQQAATGEIARNAQEARSGTENVSANVEGVREAAQQAGHASDDGLGAAQRLGTASGSLNTEAERFLGEVRAG